MTSLVRIQLYIFKYSLEMSIRTCPYYVSWTYPKPTNSSDTLLPTLAQRYLYLLYALSQRGALLPAWRLDHQSQGRCPSHPTLTCHQTLPNPPRKEVCKRPLRCGRAQEVHGVRT